MKKITIISRIVLLGAVLGTVIQSPSLHATPYASCITNSAGNISFYLNESGGNVTVTYEDGSTNSSYNGVTTGTNLASGSYTFTLTPHTSYSIAVFKTGTGTASVIHTKAYGTPRGIDVNKNPISPYFGNVYCCAASASAPASALWRLNSDLSGITTNGGGVPWANSASEPYRIAVNDDDYLTVGSFASAHSGVWRIDPTLSFNQLLLGPYSQTNGYADQSQGDQFSRPLLIGNLQSGGAATLFTVDAGAIPGVNAGQLNSVLVYSNLTLANLPRTNAPDLLGPEVCLNLVLNNNYPGITAGPVNQQPTRYLYCSNRRDGPSGIGVPTVQIYALTNLLANTAGGPTNANGPGVNLNDPTTVGCVWDSYISVSAQSDYFDQDSTGPADSAVSPDGKYFCTLGYGNNTIKVVSLTNGIPDVSTLYSIPNTVSTTSAGRGICWDAADNIYVSSSGGATFQEWSLGFTATTITTGTASGPTGFSEVLPSVSVGVYATNSIGTTTVSQPNTYGNPTTASFVISRTGSTASALTVFFTLGGTATNGTYTASATSSAVIPAGQSSVSVTVTAVAGSAARPTTSIILNLSGSSTYSLLNLNATLSLINTAPDVLVVTTNAPSMYNAFSNDFASVTITRFGDTNAATFTASSFTYGAGSAVVNQDFTPPTPVTFNPGDISHISYIYPLHNGQLPVQTSTNAYVGNKTVILGVASGSGYTGATNTAVLTIIDQAYPPATVLWSDPLTNAADAANWGVTAANNNMQSVAIDTAIAGTSENNVIFGYDLQNGDPGDFGAIPLPPSGAATALRITANKSAGASAGVNLYPTNVTFGGNYAVRFNMNIIQGDNNTTSTEGPLLGINHSGIATNWWASAVTSGWGTPPSTSWESDGIWYWINADNDYSGGAYLEYTGSGGSLPNTGWQQLNSAAIAAFSNSFKSNDFTGGVYWGSGLVSGESILNGNPYLNANWADVEIKQVNNRVTLSIDKTPVFVYTNTTAFTNGTLMLGYNDPFNSIGAPDGAAYFSNVQVVQLTPPSFSSTNGIVIASGNVTLTFSSPDATATFVLQSASSVLGAWADVSPQPAIVSLGGGSYQFTTPKTGAQEFYRVRYK